MRAPEGFVVADDPPDPHGLAEVVVVVTCTCGAQFSADDYDEGAALSQFGEHVNAAES